MRRIIRPCLTLAAVGMVQCGRPLRAEGMRQAWGIALGVQPGSAASRGVAQRPSTALIGSSVTAPGSRLASSPPASQAG